MFNPKHVLFLPGFICAAKNWPRHFKGDPHGCAACRAFSAACPFFVLFANFIVILLLLPTSRIYYRQVLKEIATMR